MELNFYYGTTLLGIIEKIENVYIYTSNIRNEQILKNKMHLSKTEYDLFDSCKRESEALFVEFKRLLWNNLPDTLERANISFTYSENDLVYKPYINTTKVTEPPWEALVKLSKLKWFPSGFYVKDKNSA